MSESHGNPTRRSFLGALLGGTSVAGLLAACHSSPAGPTPHSSAPASSGLDLDVTDFGAKGDGNSDDADSIERALGALRPGGSLTFPAGKVFRHSRVLVVNTPNTSILGPGRLEATDESVSAVQIDADGVVVRDLSLGIATTTQRWSAPEQHKLFLGPRRRVTVRNVHIDGSAAAGVFCYGTSELTLIDVRVSGTRADGIHMTNGCHEVTVESPMTSDTGDDGIAVVSYQTDKSPVRNVGVNNARVASTSGGRGMSVVGGNSVSFRNFEVNRTAAAGIYIACENGDFVTYPVQDVTVSDGTIDGANTDSAIDHGGLLVYSARDDGGVSNVQVDNVRVTGIRSSASRQIGVVVEGSAPVSDISFTHLELDRTPTPYEGNAPTDHISLHQVFADGAAVVATATP